MKLFFALFLFLSPAALLFSQGTSPKDTSGTSLTDTISTRIVLIGDAGELSKEGIQRVVNAVKKNITLDKKTVVLFLGDNLYPNGLGDSDIGKFHDYSQILDAQISINEGTKAKVYMIPGNHDWQNGARFGYDAIRREERYVNQFNDRNVFFYPTDGCPGPVEIIQDPLVTFALFDSQWFLHPYDKPGIESDCDFKTEDEVIAEMGNIALRSVDKLLIVACHHTFQSISPHGGYYTWKQYIFPFTDINKNLWIPLPVIGTIYPIARGTFGTRQDLHHPNYENMINKVTNSMGTDHNVIFVAGHDHSLQHIKGNSDTSYNYIVSGSGAKTNRVASNSKTADYKEDKNGFAVLEVSYNKNVRLIFYEVGADSVHKSYDKPILNFKKVGIVADDSLEKENPLVDKFGDTATIAASKNYVATSGIQKFMMGTNYRKEWETPVNMKVLNFHTLKGGLVAGKLGGGTQTKSLQFKDKSGKDWVLRSVDRDADKNVPENFKQTLAPTMVRDFISGEHPYGALVVPPLADALNLVVPRPELYYVPNDAHLKAFQTIFGARACFLEEVSPNQAKQKVVTTTEAYNKMLTESDHRPDQPAVLRARLLDILIADFDRHFDQWKWDVGDTGKGKLYEPVPRDRNAAFFYSNGFIMKIISLKVMPFLQGFRKFIPNVNWLGESSKDFDRIFLNDLDAGEWKQVIKDAVEKLNDSVIHGAIKELPPEIYALDSSVFTQKLLSRRSLLEKAGMTYYRFLAKKVNILGTNDNDVFKLTQMPEGVNVKVFHRKKKGDAGHMYYDRTFAKGETKEIRLYGLAGEDEFEIDSTVKSRIRVRMIGGLGNDTFDVHGNIRNYVYDVADKNNKGNYIKHKSHTENDISSEPLANYYSILSYKHNITRYPLIQVGLNTDDGFMAGTAFSHRSYSFRNEPYARFQKFSYLDAFSRKGYQFRYNAEFNHAIHKYDLIVNSEVMFPGISNYFGLGNEKKKAEDKPFSFYRAKYGHLKAEFLFQKRPFEVLRVMVGPVFYAYWNRYDHNKNTILGKPYWGGFDSLTIYSSKQYLGGKLAILIDNLNNELFPTRGVHWNTEFESLRGLNGGKHNLTQLYSNMTVYVSMKNVPRLVGVLQIGAGKIYSKNPEFFQALTLGSNTYLRGFRKDRFAGNSVLVGSLEGRLRLINIKSYLLPGDLGLIGFVEAGRVWLKGESSKRYHTSLGGGIYFMPFKLFILSATAGFSKEDRILNLSIGTKFNLNF